MILFPSSHRALHHSPVLLTLTDSHSEPEQHIRVPSSQFYNPWAPCPSCDGPVYCLVTRDTPGHTLGASTSEVRVATTSQSAHVKLVLKTRHQGSLSECCYGRHTLEENSNGFIIYTDLWTVDLALDSSLFSSWAELCSALMGRLSYVRRDYLIRIPPHEPVLIPCSFTHLEVRPLMTWVQTCNWTFCSVKAQARDTDYFRYEYFVVL